MKARQAKQNIRVFSDVYTKKKAIDLAMQNKDKAFSLVHSMKSFFKKKDTKIIVSRFETHYHPFWHIAAENYQEYKRKSKYSFTTKAEVRYLKIHGKTITIDDQSMCNIEGEDHCFEHFEKEVIRDATEKGKKGFEKYLEFKSKQIRQTEDLMGDDKVVIPATIRGSFIIQELFKELIKPIHADKIIEDRVQVTKMILYFRPRHVVELTDTATNKSGTLEIDALTGEVKAGGSLINKQLKELVSENTLFEIGAELASTIIPGAAFGAIVGKEVKERYDKKKKLKKVQKSKAAMDKSKKKK